MKYHITVVIPKQEKNAFNFEFHQNCEISESEMANLVSQTKMMAYLASSNELRPIGHPLIIKLSDGGQLRLGEEILRSAIITFEPIVQE